jgi:hypothetical protein
VKTKKKKKKTTTTTTTTKQKQQLKQKQKKRRQQAVVAEFWLVGLRFCTIVVVVMYVVKRDGRQEAVRFDKITARLKKLSYGLHAEHCDPVLVSQKVCSAVYKGVTTSQLDERRPHRQSS